MIRYESPHLRTDHDLAASSNTVLGIKRLFQPISHREELSASEYASYMHESTFADTHSDLNRESSKTLADLFIVKLVLDLKSTLHSLTTVT